jgi:hypothetical protein
MLDSRTPEDSRRIAKTSVLIVTLGLAHRSKITDDDLKDVMKMRQTQVRPRPKKPAAAALDLRTPSGRKLPF